jgi:mannose-6-phosphate isomerase-like protein (cupin superfamily)
MESGPVELRDGELFFVPKGVQHNPIAQDECLIMLIERKDDPAYR